MTETKSSPPISDEARLDELQRLADEGRLVVTYSPLLCFRYEDAHGETVDWGEYTFRALADKSIEVRAAADASLGTAKEDQKNG